jgi:hypothetical protein
MASTFTQEARLPGIAADVIMDRREVSSWAADLLSVAECSAEGAELATDGDGLGGASCGRTGPWALLRAADPEVGRVGIDSGACGTDWDCGASGCPYERIG